MAANEPPSAPFALTSAHAPAAPRLPSAPPRMRRAADASPPRRDRYAREEARRIDSDEELAEERAAAGKGEAYDPFTDALDGARSVHELSGKAAVPPPPSLYQRGGSGSASWRGRGGRDDRQGGRAGGGGGATVMGFSLAALAKMPAQRKSIWAKPASSSPAAAGPASAPHAPRHASQQVRMLSFIRHYALLSV